MKVVITGGVGFVGLNLARALLRRGQVDGLQRPVIRLDRHRPHADTPTPR